MWGLFRDGRKPPDPTWLRRLFHLSKPYPFRQPPVKPPLEHARIFLRRILIKDSQRYFVRRFLGCFVALPAWCLALVWARVNKSPAWLRPDRQTANAAHICAHKYFRAPTKIFLCTDKKYFCPHQNIFVHTKVFPRIDQIISMHRLKYIGRQNYPDCFWNSGLWPTYLAQGYMCYQIQEGRHKR